MVVRLHSRRFSRSADVKNRAPVLAVRDLTTDIVKFIVGPELTCERKQTTLSD